MPARRCSLQMPAVGDPHELAQTDGSLAERTLKCAILACKRLPLVWVFLSLLKCLACMRRFRLLFPAGMQTCRGMFFFRQGKRRPTAPGG
jgi:hypothetical protein